MIKLQNSTPEIYYKQSRDFQLLGRLYDVVLNSVKTNADALYHLPHADGTMQTRTLDLLAYTLGFQAKHNYNNTQLAAVCSVFPTLLKLKGSLAAIQLLGDTLLSSEGITEQFGCTVNGTEIQLFIPTALSTTTLFNDLLDYLMPAGMTCSIVRANTSSVAVATELAVEPTGVRVFFDSVSKRPIDLTTTSIIPSIRGVAQENSKYISNKTRYTSIYSNKEQPTKANIGNTAILDYGRLSGLNYDKTLGLIDNPGKLFYDVRYELPLRLEGGTNLRLNTEALNTWGHYAGIAFGTPKNIYTDLTVTPPETQMVDLACIPVVDTMASSRLTHQFLASTQLANSAIPLPNRNLLKNIYGDSVEITGYTITLSKQNSNPNNQPEFTLYNEDTLPIINLLTDTNIGNIPTVKQTLLLSFLTDSILTKTTLITESLNLSVSYIRPDRDLKEGTPARLAYDAGQKVCATYYTMQQNGTTGESEIVKKHQILPAEPLQTGQYTDKIQLVDTNEKKYPVFVNSFKDLELTSFKLPQLYSVTEGSDGGLNTSPQTGRFIITVCPNLKLK